MSNNELYRFFAGCMEQLDIYFFFGALTQDSEPRAVVDIQESAPYSRRGLNGTTRRLVRSHVRRIVILRSNGYGRPNKLALFGTLLHEIVHAYVNTFHGCRNERFAIDQNNGHGQLFRLVHQELIDAVSQFHPSLADVGNEANRPQPTWLNRLERDYINCMSRYGGFQREYDREGIQHGILRLAYPKYIDFVRARVPGIRNVLATSFAILFIAVTTVSVIVIQACKNDPKNTDRAGCGSQYSCRLYI
ncbi:hypothetical protein F5B20DRAFT_546136 [Whalleya microplaca]|nr:hypothetical protein F5B20DRAFT_546136 [Whalleya microplaca]